MLLFAETGLSFWSEQIYANIKSTCVVVIGFTLRSFMMFSYYCIRPASLSIFCSFADLRLVVFVGSP